MVNLAKLFLILLQILLITVSCPAAQKDSFRDPLRPVRFVPQAEQSPRQVEPAVDTSGWVLSAVLTADDRSMALINGKRLQLGDTLDGYRLMSIKADKVVMQKRNRKITLHRAGTDIKKIAPEGGFEKGSEE